MNSFISDSDFLALLTETLDAGKTFVFTPTGDSMKPMLNGSTDTVTLCKKPETLKKHDVVLFTRKTDGALILHRIVKVIGDRCYTLSGDSQFYFDTDVDYDSIHAVVVSHTHNGKVISSSDLSYRLYITIILLKKYTHIFFSKIYHSIFK